MNLKETKLGGKRIYDGKIIKVDLDDVELPDGKTAKRECVRHPGGAAALCIEDGKVLLVKQFRYVYGKEIYEIPAGKLEPGEDAAVAAKRELEEEAGLSAEKITPFLKLYPTPGYTDEIIYVYLAENCRKVKTRLDEGEFLTAEFVPLGKVIGMIDDGVICDGKTIAAVYKYLTVKK